MENATSKTTTRPAVKFDAGLASLLSQVKAHCDALAADDAAFAERYANPKKSIEECCMYLAGEAWARASGGRVSYIPPTELFGMAVHYFDEDEVTIRPLPYGGRVETSAPMAEAIKNLTPEQKAQAERDALERYAQMAVRKQEEKERERRAAEAKRRKEGRNEAKQINDAWEGASLFDE